MPMTEFAADSGTPVVEAAAPPPADIFAMLDLRDVVPSLTNPRTHFDEAKLAELAESIKASGVHQPILVRPLPAARVPNTGKRVTHEVVAGERRLRASQVAGLTSIPALVRRLTDAQVLEIQIIENLQREDLTELEEAEGYQRLVEQTSIAKEAIGEKIGKSRGYVYARLKLLDLNPACREALRKGEIDASKALLIARIPDDKLQIKALGQATGTATYGHPLSVKDLQAWLQTNVMLSLKRTSFDIQDATLREGASACPDCPKRTGANPDLFADVESADLCTDPTCYHDKEKTAAERRFEAAQRAGKKVIDEAKAKSLHKPHERQWLKGYHLLDEYPDYRLELNGSTLRKALGKHCPEPVLVKHPESGDVVEVVEASTLAQVIKAQGLSRSAKLEAAREGKKADAAQKPIEERQEYRDRWQTVVAGRTDAHLKTLDAIPPELLRAWLLDRFEGYDEGAFGPALDLGTEFHTGKAHDRLLSMPEAELPRLMLRFMLWSAEDEYDAWSAKSQARQGPRTTLFELVHMAGVDVTAVQAEVKRAMESEDRAAELEAKAKAEDKAKPTLKGKKPAPATPSPAAPAKRGGKKTTKAEAAREISAQLQGLEDSDRAPDGAELDKPAAATAGQLSPMLAWPFPNSSGPIQAKPAPTFRIGAVARVKAGSKSAGGKALKTVGRIGRVIGIGEDGRVHFRHGERSHELVVLQPEQLEPYLAQPLPGGKVRIVGLSAGEKHLWRHGVVRSLTADGWVVTLTGKNGAVGDLGTFPPEDLEVLE